MLVRKDLLFSSLAIASGKVTGEQLEECQKLQREQNYYKSIGTLMVEKGYLKPMDVKVLLGKQEENLKEAVGVHSAGSGETLFGTVAVMKKYATLSQVEECLADSTTSTTVPLPGGPDPGGAWWVLVRSELAGTPTSYDAVTEGQRGTRDAGIAAAPGACP